MGNNRLNNLKGRAGLYRNAAPDSYTHLRLPTT